MTELFIGTKAGKNGSHLPRKIERQDKCDLITIIGFDPGGTTGWAVLNLWPDAFYPENRKVLEWLHSWSAGQFNGPEDIQVDLMIDLVKQWPEESDIVVEDFILRAYRRGRELLAPVRITAAFAYELRWIGHPRRGIGRQNSTSPRQAILQQPSLAMTTITDQRLKDIGMYPPVAGKPHAKDALRHVLTWARRRKHGFNWDPD